MAIGTPIDRGTASRGYSSSNIDSASFTPAADAILLCFVVTRSTGLIPTSITGHDGGTAWVQIGTTQSYGGHGASLWGCHTGSSPSAATVSVAIATTAQAQIGLAEVTGVDVSGTVANSFDDTDAATGYASSVTRSITPGSNLTMGFWGSGFSRTLTPEGTVLNQLNHPSATIEAAIDYDTAGDTSPSCTLSSSGPYFSYAVELKAAASGANTITTESGAYVYTGTAVALERGLVMPSESGSYAYTGASADLDQGFYLATDSGAYNYTGTAVTLTFVPVGNFTLTADSGSYAYTGTAAALLSGRNLVAASGSYNYTGTALELQRGLVMAGASGAYVYTGASAGLLRGLVVVTESGSYVYSGTAVILDSSAQIWTLQADSVTIWADQSDASTAWSEKIDETTTWTIQ